MNSMSNIGIDLVEINDIKKRLSERFIERILGSNELLYYHSITHPKRKLEYIAGRFAAKEAYVKAYRLIEEPLDFKDVEVLNDPTGVPKLSSKYRPNDQVIISLSHTKNYAIAVVMITRIDEGEKTWP